MPEQATDLAEVFLIISAVAVGGVTVLLVAAQAWRTWSEHLRD